VNASDIAEQELLDYCQKYAAVENENLIIEKQLKLHWKKHIQLLVWKICMGDALIMRKKMLMMK